MRRRPRFKLLLAAIIVAASGCASTGFLMAKPKVVMFTTPGEPRPVDAPVQIFYTTQPAEPYEEVAKIDVGDTDDKWCMEQITKKAREIGADGVIILGRVGSYGVATGALNTNGRNATASGVGVAQEYGMSALAIRFKQH